MCAIQCSRQKQIEDGREVNILVTGFGPFGDNPVNTSYLIASTLPVLLPATPACPVAVRIVFYPYQLPVAYDEVRSLVPRLYEAYEGSVDIVLHMGMAPGRAYYSIEKLAHRDGYDAHADTCNVKMDKDDGKSFWKDCPEILETSLAFDDIFQRWRSNLLSTPDVAPELDNIMLRPSQDAGHFICDFIYYSSLAEHWRRKKDRSCEDDKIDERPVMFMHVPAWAGATDLNKGRLMTIALVKAMAQSWIAQKSQGKTGK